jgi:hypothetical protein
VAVANELIPAREVVTFHVGQQLFILLPFARPPLCLRNQVPHPAIRNRFRHYQPSMPTILNQTYHVKPYKTKPTMLNHAKPYQSCQLNHNETHPTQTIKPTK